ncbi:K02A2.6-like [Cordylochernes scorpioides]|uniref:RNA-directed DNA polymerase n=1 Tax=Cordylochernes scorpioides TaxID=51811 RepID=A0ABY6LIF8_9ARAC|nr:K02A2.6-like [Cordylochernes scorpioides]
MVVRKNCEPYTCEIDAEFFHTIYHSKAFQLCDGYQLFPEVRHHRIADRAQSYFKLAEEVALEKLETKSFDEIVALLNRHLAPTPRVIPARYNFFKSSQEDETISQFMATLRGLAEPCKFGSMLNEMLRDKLVVGVRYENLQKRLLQEGDDATLDKIYQIALSYEAAEGDLLSMKKKISPINLHLKSYSITKIDVIGKREVFVAEANKTLPLIITEANRSVLLGTTWIKCLPAKFLKFSDINLVQETTCSFLVNKFAEVFGTSNVGVFKDHKAHLIFRKDANPRFFRARNVPYVMRNAIEKELENLEAQAVITKIERSDWATPIVPIMKKNGHVRICGYFKITLNPVLKIDQYPLPKIEDIFAILGRGIKFSKIDLSQAYLQLELDDNSKEMAKFEAVLNRLNEYGLKANREKCNFFQESLEYCGHVIDKMGLHKTNDKIRAVLDAPEPLNVTQLRAFLGLITYYHKFIRNAADVLSPLYALLKKGTKWHFSTECRKAFRQIKEIISSDQILIAYDPKLPIRLLCDSSSYGLGAVLSQIDVDGNERPIYFISRTLSQAEKKYSQIDKECLSIIWALKKFNNYLFGRKFELITNNKPLHHILNPKREISSNMSARLQRWALILYSYNFTIECRKTGDHGNADGLSRLPLKQYEEMEEDAVNTVHMIKQCEELPLTSSHIRRESCKDSILKIVYQNTLYGRKDKPSNTELLSFYLRREELTVEQGILLLGTRVVIPRKFRAKIKAELHQGHLGVVKMKALARNFIWWPGIDREIEEITRVCRECNINSHTLKQESVHRWESAPTPWYRVHLDFAGPFMNKMFLIVIDSYSKWPEVIIMNSTTAGNTIRVLRD